MAEFKYFKSLSTGKTGRYPAHYANRESFVEVDPDTGSCIGCQGEYANASSDDYEVPTEDAYYDYGNDTDEIKDA